MGLPRLVATSSSTATDIISSVKVDHHASDASTSTSDRQRDEGVCRWLAHCSSTGTGVGSRSRVDGCLLDLRLGDYQYCCGPDSPLLSGRRSSLSPASWQPRLHSLDDILPARTDMESIHGVDVSWLHHTKGLKEHDQRKHRDRSTPSTTPLESNAKPSSSPTPQFARDHRRHEYFPGPVTPQALSEPAKDTTNAISASTPSRPQSRRPGLLNRRSSEKIGANDDKTRRSNSWISNFSNKFSSQSSSSASPERPGNAPTSPSLSSASHVNGNGHTQFGEQAEPHIPLRSKEPSSFFSSLSRKLSAGSQVGSAPKVSGKAGICERRVLNVDPNRERCLVPEMDTSRLRKVSFCVDVEIAGGPRYKDDEGDEEDDWERKRRKKDMKLKERAEGEAMKNPEALKEEKDGECQRRLDRISKPLPMPGDISNGDDILGMTKDSETGSPRDHNAEDQTIADEKREKKKKSEEERRERKEKRRRRAEENGSVPVEVPMDPDITAEMDADGIATSLPDRTITSQGPNITATTPLDSKRDRPTTDPVRIYRRCCQLRETPILKRITEQLMAPNCCAPFEPGVVTCLNLTGSRLQVADMITLGDWLAVVPVKRLLLEDADLSDEGLRCILAGLLAAKIPELSKRKSMSPRHREPIPTRPHQERAGVVERLTLKNNPRITRTGWKHISLFLYLCRSIKAIDLSMIRFPDTLPPSVHATPVKSSQGASKGSGEDTEAAETLFKCLSQRLGGNKLEELILAEGGFSGQQIRKIVDGAIVCGISRLGFADNNLDDEGLDAVLNYLQSGVCGGLDLGGNDLRNKLGRFADALDNRSGTPCWGLSLAGCNLDTSSIKPLFPALVKLSNFRFLDLSHNRELCTDNGTISLLRRYIGQMKYLKRIHLADVSMSSKQAIALADVLPEGPQLAHLNIMENPKLTALAHAREEEDQEEACALYASYMAAVRVSTTLICIDIDVPSPENSEVVKALAKQVVAYSLRNMERFAVAEATGDISASTADAAASLTQLHGGEQQLKEITVPDVLMHLVGHVEGDSENHDQDDPAPGDDYIVGGTGVVKALQYVLGEKADDLRRSSVPSTPISGGTRTPRERPTSSAGLNEQQQLKAKKMSKNLLESARKIRARLQPALAKEANAGDEMAFRRLNFLDQTLQSMIQRFEEEYPETRITPPSPARAPSLASSVTEQSGPLSVSTAGTEFTNISDDEDEVGQYRPAVSRHNSDVSLASRALALEEGHLHRIGQRMRRDIVDSPASAIVPEDDSAPWKEQEAERLQELQRKLESLTGPELKSVVEKSGWDAALQKVGANIEDLRNLQEQDPQGWEQFKESQMKARMNVAQDARRTK